MTEPIVLESGNGRALQIGESTLTVKAGNPETGGAYSFIEASTPPGGFGPLAHTHTDREESFYVLEGEIDFTVGESTIRGTAGSFLLVPRGVLHTFANAGAGIGRLLIVHSPGLERYFEELAALLSAPEPDLAALPALMRRHGMEVPGT